MVKINWNRNLLKWIENYRNFLFEKATHQKFIPTHRNTLRSISTDGLTLVELLVTTTIVGIIAMGMVSIDYALRTNEQQQSRSALVSLRTSATLTDITTTARQAYGDTTSRCIQTAANMAVDNTNYICIYRDVNVAAPHAANLTPTDFTDDSWTCYTRRGTNIHKCYRAVAAGLGSCVAGDPVIGTVTTDSFNLNNPIAWFTTTEFRFIIQLKNRYDPTQVKAYITNPEIIMALDISPQGCSF